MPTSDTTRNNLYLVLLTLLCVSAAMVLPMYFNGIPNGNDLPQHYQFALTFKEAIVDGSLYPSWSSTSNAGFGDAGVRFYPPFSYYVLAAVQSVAGNWYDASIWTFFFWFFLSGVGIYLWTREFFSTNASLLAATCYIVAPYHANQIFNAFTYAEFAAASILPFCFLFVTRACRYSRLTDVLLLGLSYALLVLTHLPMAVIGSISLLVFSIFSLQRAELFRQSLRLGSSVALGLLMSSFYWLRMGTELQFIRHATDQFRSAAYDFHSNFLAAFLYVTQAEYFERSLWFGDLVLLMTLCVFLPGLLLLLLRWERKEIRVIRGPLATIILAILFATPLSLPIWERVTLLQQIQFPWRWLAIITLIAAFLVAAAHKRIVEAFSSKLRPIALLAVGLIIATIVFTGTQVIKPAMYIQRDQFLEIVDSLQTANSYECWWPTGSRVEALREPAKVNANGRPVEILNWQPTHRSLIVEPGEAQDIRIGTFYYPRWTASVNGQPIVPKSDENGAMIIPIGAERSAVEIEFREPRVGRVASVLSIFSLLSMIGALLVVGTSDLRKRRTGESKEDRI